jgi:ribose transport system substrate-binding protein
MKKFRVVLCMALAALGLVAVAGCGSDSSSGSGGDGEVVLGLSNSSVDSVWRPQMIKDFESEAQKLKDEGKIKDYVVQNADGTAATQSQQIQTMISQGVNALVIDAASATALNGVVNQAVSRGATVVSFDNPITSDKSLNLYQDEEAIAGETATRIAELAGGKGTVVMMNGTAGAPLSDAREELATKAFEEFPDIKVIKAYADWNGAKAKQKMATILESNPDITGVWTQGSMAPAIASAFDDAGKPLPPIVSDGLGGFLKTWDELKKSEDYETVGIVVPPAIVKNAVWAAMALKDGYTANENEMVLKRPLITNDTLDEYLKLDTPAGKHINVPVVPEEEFINDYFTAP